MCILEVPCRQFFTFAKSELEAPYAANNRRIFFISHRVAVSVLIRKPKRVVVQFVKNFEAKICTTAITELFLCDIDSNKLEMRLESLDWRPNF